MPKKAIQSSDWDFSVVPVQLPTPSGKPSGVWVNMRKDNEQVVGVISEKGYGLLQNIDFVKTIRDALNALGLTDYREDIIALHSGKQLFATYHFDNRVKPLHKVGDQVGLVLRFCNSFDGSLAARGELRAKILRCLNGMCLEKGSFSLQKRHNRRITMDFVSEVTAKAVNDFDRALAVFDALAGIPISDEQGVNVLSHIPGVSKALREKVAGIWIAPNFAASRARTLYALYDAATEHLRDLESQRFEQASKLNRVFLRHIVKCVDPAILAVMTKPLPVVEVEATEVEE